MNFELMTEKTRYLKEDPKEVSEMCQIMEDMRNESLKEGIQEEKKCLYSECWKRENM